MGIIRINRVLLATKLGEIKGKSSLGLSDQRDNKLIEFWGARSYHQGIVKRDEIVFRAARRRGIPILMVTSGGYQKKTARIIADSILNLRRQGLVGAAALEEDEGAGPSLVPLMMNKSVSAGGHLSAL